LLSEYFDQYLTVLAFGVFGAVLVGLLLGVASLIRPSDPTPAKLETYESGIDPIGGGWSQTNIRYYVFALLFLIFDVEAVFIFPWALKLEELGGFALWEMFIFIGILLMGLLYAIRKGVLRWE
jgi:NADH-quinone oxidoreductase subunit A